MATPFPAEPLPYVEMTESRFAEEAAKTFIAQSHPEGIVLSGNCPRCGAPIQVPLLVETFSRGVRWGRGTYAGPPPATARRSEPIICTCEEPHPGRPDGYVGCGAYWTLVLTEEES